MMLVTLALPDAPFASIFSLVPLPGTIMAVILLITASYLAVSELTKRAFPRRLETGQTT